LGRRTGWVLNLGRAGSRAQTLMLLGVFYSKEAWLGGEGCKRRMENRNTVVVKCSVI
jgi:hypothetical protein